MLSSDYIPRMAHYMVQGLSNQRTASASDQRTESKIGDVVHQLTKMNAYLKNLVIALGVPKEEELRYASQVVISR